MDDASLDDFYGETDEGASDGDGGPEASDGDGGPQPTHSTYRWHPDGAECADCGATVERRWRDGGRFVCGDCKAW